MTIVMTTSGKSSHDRRELGAPAWGGLLWATPLAYLLVDPYRRGAGWLEWSITTVTLLVFVALYTLGLVFWRRKEVVRWQCVAAMVVAVAFSAYRPAGGILFAMIAAFLPFSVNGRIAASAILVATLVATFAIEWLALGRSTDSFFYVIVFQSLLLGAGTTFIARQQLENERLSRGAERQRIARDLHDTLGQTLTTVALKSELARRLLDRDVEAARRELADVEQVSRKALAEIREVIHGYTAGGIRAELERAERVLVAAGIVVEQDHDPQELSAAQERILGLVLRESITNVVRHAEATHCRISLGKSGDAVCLTVTDDGRGGVHEEGLGMASIRARLESIGGHAAWDGRDGTALTVTLPAAARQ